MQISPVEFVARGDGVVKGESCATLVGVRQPQSVFIPRIDKGRFITGNAHAAAVGCLHCAVAAHVVRMAMGIDKPVERPAGKSSTYFRQGLRGIAPVTAVDENRTVAAA